MFFLGFVASMQKFVSKQGVCIGTAGKICSPLDLKVCMRIHGVATIFLNECEACKHSYNLKIIRAPMTDYTYCYKNETEQQCCTGLK
jgi:hypothetical protein